MIYYEDLKFKNPSYILIKITRFILLSLGGGGGVYFVKQPTEMESCCWRKDVCGFLLQFCLLFSVSIC